MMSPAEEGAVSEAELDVEGEANINAAPGENGLNEPEAAPNGVDRVDEEGDNEEEEENDAEPSTSDVDAVGIEQIENCVDDVEPETTNENNRDSSFENGGVSEEKGDEADNEQDEILETTSERGAADEERDGTPTLDENLPIGLEGLETEPISEEEEREAEEGEIIGEEKVEIAWKKPSGRRNYRDKKAKEEEEEKVEETPKLRPIEEKRREARKKEKKKQQLATKRRKDLERYDVRRIVNERKDRRPSTDRFGRVIRRERRSEERSSPESKRRRRSSDRRHSSERRRESPEKRHSVERRKHSPDRRKGSPARRKSTPDRRKSSPERRKVTPDRRKGSPERRKGSPERRKGSPERRKGSADRRKSPERRKSSPERRKNTPERRRHSSERRRHASESRQLSPERRRSLERRNHSPVRRRSREKRHSPEVWPEVRRTSPDPRRSVHERLGFRVQDAEQVERRRRKRKKEKRRKEVIARGNNILISVNFKKQREPPQERPRTPTPPPPPPPPAPAVKEKKKKERRKKIAKMASKKRPIAVINLEAEPAPEVVIPEGPKTPPEPQIKFSIMTKTSLKPLVNPLHEEEEDDEEVVQAEPAPEVVPEAADPAPTQPEESTDVYNPFEPTNSPAEDSKEPEPEEAPLQEEKQDEEAPAETPAQPEVQETPTPEPVEEAPKVTTAASPPKIRPPPPVVAVPPLAASLVLQPQLNLVPLLLQAAPTLLAQLRLPNSVQTQLPDTTTDVVDMELESPYSPAASEGDDLFEPPAAREGKRSKRAPAAESKAPGDKFDALRGAWKAKTGAPTKTKSKKEITIKMDEDQLRILDDVPSSAVELQVKEKYLKKLNHQERVVDEVKLALKPHYARKKVNKDQYKEILRRAVPKICHSRRREINPHKVRRLVSAYIKKICGSKSKTTAS
ncbi:PHD and RING finger domain-containing protein 1-like [Cloeon dipterum]|uniref:PHD and RING finger domain-containing protein 1-like n=1 Tax=Cloeon dipterum TaxID=197152 RepID=UPI00321F9B59